MSAPSRPRRKKVKVGLDLNTMLYCVVTVPDLRQITNPMPYKMAQHYRRQIQAVLDASWSNLKPRAQG